MIDQQNFVEARKKLLQVNLHDQDNSQACFYLGLLAALVEHNSSDGRKYFMRVLKSGAENVACLNNLALAAVRSREVSQAVSYWKRSAELGSAPEVSHNIGLLFLLAERNRLNVPAGLRQDLEQKRNSPSVTWTSSEGKPTGHGVASSRGRAANSSGWWYMDFMGESAVPTDWHWPNLSDRACLVCNGMRSNCPVNNCSRGIVRVSTVETIPLPRGNFVKKQRFVPVPCKNCRGTGRVPCPFCSGGIDRDL